MTSKGYRHTEETKRKMSETRRGKNNPNYGKKHTEQTKKLMSKHRKGKCTGEENPNYGKTFSAETRRKMSEARIGKYTGKNSPHYGKPKSAEHRRKLRDAAKNRLPFSEETKRKMGDSHRGAKNPNYGKTLSEEYRKKISDSRRGKCIGKENPSWKGGISWEPYGPKFNDILKREIRERDNYTCQWCGVYGKYVHHINGDHKNSEPWNLIILCLSCNAKEQYQRDKMMPIFYEKNKKHYEPFITI